MVELYDFTLIVGGGLTVLSFMSDVFDSELDMDGDGGVGEASFGKLLATYGLLYFCLGFGATGTLLALVVGVAPTLHLAGALVAGTLCGTGAAKLLHWLKRNDTGQLPGDASWSGSYGTMLLPAAPASPGEVRVSRGHREVRLRALPHASWEQEGGGVDPAEWRSVMVVEVKDGIAFVVPSEETRD